MPDLNIRGATVLWGRALDQQQRDVVIRNGMIEGDPSGARPEARQLDLDGYHLLPGFIDAHVHIGFSDPMDVLTGGITTARDLGWPQDEIFGLARASRSTSFDGPEVLAVGPLLTVQSGYPTRAAWAPQGTGLVVDDPRGTVTRLAERGAVAIKVALNADVGPTLEATVLQEIVAAAHERGLKVTAHINQIPELEKSLDAAVDEMAHMLMSNDRIPAELIERMVGAGMTVVPTLSCRSGDDLRTAIDNLARFLSAGGRVVYGTDLGNEGPRPGIDPNEIAALIAAGMSGLQVIASATVDSAEWLGLPDRGVLKEGNRADVIGYRAEPWNHPEALPEPDLVIRQGRVVKGP